MGTGPSGPYALVLTNPLCVAFVVSMYTAGVEMAAGHPVAAYHSLQRAKRVGKLVPMRELSDTAIAVQGWMHDAAEALQ